MKHAVVTGANRGIGLEFCRQLIEQGYSVTALCRRGAPELGALGCRVVEGFDVTSQQALDGLATNLKPASVDLLINNAGVADNISLNDLDLGSMRFQFEVNALGPLRVTQALLPALKPGSKVALITSRMGSIADNTSGGSYGYRMSKAALNAAGVSLAQDVAGQGVSVAILHPGYVRTDMTGHYGLIDVDESVSGLLQRIESLGPENSGTFWHCNGEVLPW